MLSEFYNPEPGLNPSIAFITDVVDIMHALFQERHNDRESCITVKG